MVSHYDTNLRKTLWVFLSHTVRSYYFGNVSFLYPNIRRLTILVWKYSFRHYAINACLAPLYSVEGMHVITVEGLGSCRLGLHPIQVIVYDVLYYCLWCTLLFIGFGYYLSCYFELIFIHQYFVLISVTSFPGISGSYSRFTMWILYTWFCHVHVCVIAVKSNTA